MREFFSNEGIDVHFSSAKIKTGNADIERVHGTINEHLRIMKVNKINENITKRVIQAMEYYNETIHSTTEKRPIDFLNCKMTVRELKTVKERIDKKQKQTIDKRNKNRDDEQPVEEGQVYVQADRVRKSDPKYKLINIKLRNGKILDNRDRNVHPQRIKRKYK